jgi:predicted RNA-binding Zn-ribbon protein involved in translation (DUF1610 family)
VHEITERVAYLKGMVEGLDIGKESKEGRVITGMIDILHDLAHTVNDLHHAQSELETYVETLDEDLYDLEDEVFMESSDDDEFEDDDEYVEVECPTCRETVCFDPDILADEDLVEITCPNCETVVFMNDESLDYSDDTTSDI